MREPLTITTRIFNPNLRRKHVMVKGCKKAGIVAIHHELFSYSGRVANVGIDYIEIKDFDTGDLRSLNLADIDGDSDRFYWVKVYELGATEEITEEGESNGEDTTGENTNTD